MSSIFSPASEGSALDLKEPECERSPSARLSLFVAPFSISTGRLSLATRMSGRLPQSDWPRMAYRQSTLFAEDSHAKILAMPATVLGSTAKGQGFGVNMLESLAIFDPASSSWKTSQLCLLEDLGASSEAWPRSGMTRNGIAYPLPPLAPRISAIGFGYLPTPDKSLGEMKGGITLKADARTCFRRMNGETRPSGATIGSSLRWCPEFIRESLRTGGLVNPGWLEALMGFPDGWSMLEMELWETLSPPPYRKSSGAQ